MSSNISNTPGGIGLICIFSTSLEQVQAASENPNKIVNDKDLKDLSFLDPNRVKEAFNDMREHNSGGPDTMKSVVFQNLPYNVLTRISKLYKVCIKLSHAP